MEVCRSAISKKLLDNDRWTTYKIQDIAKIGRGRVISSVEIERQKHPLYPVYSSQTSNDGIMGYLDDYMFDGEYITWTTDGANAGTVFYRKGKFNCTNVCGTLKIQPKYDCYFVSLVLQQATQKYVSFNLANPKLMNNIMASIKIKMPDIEMQKQLSKIFQTLDSCLLVHQRTCDMYSREKQYLLCQMFIWTSAAIDITFVSVWHSVFFLQCRLFFQAMTEKLRLLFVARMSALLSWTLSSPSSEYWVSQIRYAISL